MSTFRIALLTVAALVGSVALSPRASAQGISPAGKNYQYVQPGNPRVANVHFNQDFTYLYKDSFGVSYQGIWGMDNYGALYTTPNIYLAPCIFKGFNAFGTSVDQLNCYLVFRGY